MKKLRTLLSLPCLALLLASCSGEAKKNTQGAAARLVAADVIVLNPRPFNRHLVATGSLLAKEEVSVQSEVSGRITAINFSEGQPVAEGRLLVKMDDEELQARLLKLQYEEKLAADEEYRNKKLLEAKGISEEEYQVALNKLQTLQADMALVKAEIANTEIRAPFDGIIGLRQVSQGAYLTAGMPVATLQQVSRLKVEFSVPETEAALLKNGMEIAFTTSGTEEVFTAVIYALEPKIDPVTRSLKARAVFDNGRAGLRPGSFVKIRIGVSGDEGPTLLLPSHVIKPGPRGNSVFVLKGGKAVETVVVTGLRTDSLVQVTGGLQAGDTVIATGLMQVRNGSPVKVRKAIPQ